ncbi:MAG TPA: universal stress protein [bacterium]|nr:universal stress protein [bacterium]HPN43357.1 universal stress protein [bacterium]
MFKNIMLAVDGSVYTEYVLSLGATIARAFRSHIHVLTVADIRVFEWATAIGADGFVPIAPSSMYQKESIRLMEEKCSKVLEKCAQILKKENLDFELEKQVAAPVDAIVERSQIADLLIMGKCGEFSRWDKKKLGATVEAVSRAGRKPIIVADKFNAPITNILFGYDGSPNANQVMQYVGHLAENCHAAVTVLCVSDEPELAEQYIRNAEKYLKNFKINLNSLILPGSPDKEIIKYAQANDLHFIAIGAYGHSRMHEVILGSSTENILRFAPCHVMLAK